MLRTLTPASSLDELKRGAKHWLRALRDGDPEARARYERALPDGPPDPTLRTVQLALARGLGFAGWAELKHHAERPREAAVARDEMETLVDRFLDNACPDHHVRGRVDHQRAQHTALRLLARYPEIRHARFSTDVVCGDLDRVASALAADPSLAARSDGGANTERTDSGGQGDMLRADFGPKGWEPLLHLCFTRLPLDEVTASAVAIARTLLEHGASATSYFMAGGSRYTPLVGAIGEGEEHRPPHQCRGALVRLLLDYGADPFDAQVTYNIHFRGDVLWFLELAHEYSVKAGLGALWDDPDWSMIDAGEYGHGARWYLWVAIQHGDVELARWCLEHGASPNAAAPAAQSLPQRSLYELAVRRGETAIARLLADHGADVDDIELSVEERFEHGCMRLDREAVQREMARDPELLRSYRALHEAARRDRVDVLRFILDLGVSPDVENAQHERALHAAAYAGSLAAARLLIERGAEIDPVESHYSNTPMGAAAYYQNREMLDLLAPLSRDVWELTAAGKVDRLSELFAENPERARASWKGNTPLMWIAPQDEARAIEIARLFLAYGTDAALENDEGMTVADRADRLGMFNLAALMRDAAAEPGRYRIVERYERMAENLLAAYRTGTPEAMERHWGDTWHRRNWQAMRRYVQLDLGRQAESEEGSGPIQPDPQFDISIAEARSLIAQQHRRTSWRALVGHVLSLPLGADSSAPGVLLWSSDADGPRSHPIVIHNWAEGLERSSATRLAGLDAGSAMTDEMLVEVSRLGHVRSVKFSGSRALTPRGFRLLSHMPQLRDLDMSDTSVTDDDLAMLRELPALERIDLSNTRVTDAGAVHLAACERLRSVNLAWTVTGDGMLAALSGKTNLRRLHTGKRVTDVGVALLRDIPNFENWHGGDPREESLERGSEPNHLTLRGAITDAGLRRLIGLNGLFGFDIADVALAITPRGLAPLVELPRLASLSVEATDESMPYIASMPGLRSLMCQDTAATDDGFVALSRSRTIERIWGRRCHGLGDRGFVALSTMPALRNLAVSCRNVSDEGLAALPAFPALRELMPIDVRDEGYRFVARCMELDTLTLMYCRDTTDRATEYISILSKLRRYFASYTRISDRTPELLSGMTSLQDVELASCAGVTNEGVAALARLPRLRRVRLSGMPSVDTSVAGSFSLDVDVDISL